MNYLLDTCTFVWVISDSKELSLAAKTVFIDPAHSVYLSAVSIWEMAVKHSLGRLDLPAAGPAAIPNWRRDHGIELLPLGEEETLYEGRLPKVHGDPFDRMLICQAIVHELVLLTPDTAIQKYPIRTYW